MKSNATEAPGKRVVTRFPPSPTGFFHIGSARTALFNYLFAKKLGGTFLLRIEDTDVARSKKEFEDVIIDSLAWLGIAYDNEKPLRQSERIAVYRTHLQKLFESGAAYESDEALPDGLMAGKRGKVIRFRNPKKKITFLDLIRGDITFDTTDLGDFVIAKSLSEPLYHLAVVIDDFETGITHVIRGEDHISNTPRQILIQEALGFPRPIYAHIPLILGPDRSKLSKRHGALSVTEYRDRGYLPEAFVNYLALLGWNPGTEKEIFSLSELTREFDLSRVQKAGAIFNEEKLRWMNHEYLKQLPAEVFQKKAIGFLPPEFANDTSMTGKILPLILDRISAFGDITTMAAAGEFGYFFTAPIYKKELLLWKKETDFGKMRERLGVVAAILSKLADPDFTKEKVKSAIFPFAEREGRGGVLWPLRVALSGREKSPDPFVLAEVLGKERTLKRLQIALNLLS